MAVQRPCSRLCASREGVCLVPLSLATSPCHFPSFIPSLCIFPTVQPNQNFPALFPTSQRLPEAPRCTHDDTSNTVVSSPLLQLLSFLCWWPLCWDLPGVIWGSRGLSATSGVHGVCLKAHCHVPRVLSQEKVVFVIGQSQPWNMGIFRCLGAACWLPAEGPCSTPSPCPVNI